MERKAESIKNTGTLAMSGRAKAGRRTPQENLGLKFKEMLTP